MFVKKTKVKILFLSFNKNLKNFKVFILYEKVII